jgi:hypothetical protein
MVGIATGRGFKTLRHVDQFALLGMSPATKLTFEELLKQAIRVAVLLHTDFDKPSKVVPPFPSATANDLKGWLQANANSEADRQKAVKLFYGNTGGHCGLTWRPYLKDKNGALVPRTDTAIWRLPGSTPPPSPPPKKRKRKPKSEEDGMPVTDKKQKTQSFKSGSQQTPDSAHVPRPEKDLKKSGTKPSFQQKPDHSDSAHAPKPEERAEKTSGTNSSSQKRPGRSGGTQDSKPDKEPESTSSKPSANQKDDYSYFPPGFGQKYAYNPSARDAWTFEEWQSASNNADTSTPEFRTEPKRKDSDDPASSPPTTSRPNSPAQKPSCSDDPGHAVPERERRAYGTKSSARAKSSWFQNASGRIPERHRNTYAAKPMFRKDFTKADTPHNSPPRSRAANPEQRKAPEEKDGANMPPPKQAPTPEHHEEFEQHDNANVPSPPHAPTPESSPHTRYPLKSLIDLAHTVGDPTRGRVAIACLPYEQDRVVVMQFHPSYQVRYCVEQFDVRG